MTGYKKIVSIFAVVSPLVLACMVSSCSLLGFDSEAWLSRMVPAWVPSTPEEHLLFADSLFDARLYEDAAREYKEATRFCDIPGANYQLGRAYFIISTGWDFGSSEPVRNIRHETNYDECQRLAIAAFESEIQKRPTDVQSRLAISDVLRWRGELEKAVEHLRVVARIHPDSADVHWRLSNLLSDDQDAMFEIKKALSLDPHNEDYKQRLAELYLSADDGRQGEMLCKEILDKSPTNCTVRGYLASLYEDQGRLELAIEECEKEMKIHDNGHEGRTNAFLGREQMLAHCLARSGKIEDAIRVYEHYLPYVSDSGTSYQLAAELADCGHYVDSIEQNRLFADQENAPAPQLKIADCLVKLRRTGEAKLYARKALGGLADAATINSAAEKAYLTGLAYKILGESDKSKGAFVEGARENLQKDGPYYIGLCMAEAGDFNGARKVLAQCRVENSDVELGLVCIRSGNYSEGVDRLRESLRRNPQNVRAHEELGLVLRKLGRSTEAEIEFDLAQKISSMPIGKLPVHVGVTSKEEDAPNVEVSNEPSLTDRAIELIDQKKYNAALPIVEEICASDPHSYWYEQLSKLLDARGESTRALAILEVARRLKAEEPIGL